MGRKMEYWKTGGMEEQEKDEIVEDWKIGGMEG